MSRGAEFVIEAGGSERQYWGDLWRYRELFYFLAWRDILVRYKQTVAGLAWAVLRPLLMMVVLTFVFGRLARMPAGAAPYPILVLAGMLPWQFFSTAVTDCGNSLVGNATLISKVYFPRMTVPASALVTSLVDFAVALPFVLPLMAWYHYVPTLRVLALPAAILWMIAVAAGAGLWVAALTVQYRDVRFVVPFVVQFGLYLSPVGFSSDVVAGGWRLAYSLNPMTGVIDAFRWALLQDATFSWPGAAVSLAVTVLVGSTGVRYFRHTERGFADVI